MQKSIVSICFEMIGASPVVEHLLGKLHELFESGSLIRHDGYNYHSSHGHRIFNHKHLSNCRKIWGWKYNKIIAVLNGILTIDNMMCPQQ